MPRNPRRELGVIRDYRDLQALLRRRVEEVDTPRLALDRVAGLPEGYSATLLALNGAKILGRMSFGVMLQTLGLKLIAVEAESLAAVRSRLRPRHRRPTHVVYREPGSKAKSPDAPKPPAEPQAVPPAG